jgi:hypothetical protein
MAVCQLRQVPAPDHTGGFIGYNIGEAERLTDRLGSGCQGIADKSRALA